MTAVEQSLTSNEVEYLSTLESRIAAGLKTFVEVGTALAEVRDLRLYRAEHATFEEYCGARWSFTPQHAGRLITAAAVAKQIEPIGSIANEAQARALAAVPEPERAEVWQAAVAESNGKPTAAAVTQAAQRLTVVRSEGGLRDQLRQPAPVWTVEEEALRKRLHTGDTVVASYRHHMTFIDWAEAAGFLVRVDRRSDWGNPFELPHDGDRDTVIKAYEHHYLPHKPSLIGRIPELRGMVLACWCAPEPCHADVLARWADE